MVLQDRLTLQLCSARHLIQVFTLWVCGRLTESCCRGTQQLDDAQMDRRVRHARQTSRGAEESRDLSPPAAERPMSPPPGAAPHVVPGPPIWPSADEQFRVQCRVLHPNSNLHIMLNPFLFRMPS